MRTGARKHRAGHERERRSRFVTWRALLLGALILPLNSYWLTWHVWNRYHISGFCSLPNTTVFVLAVLLGVNWVAKRLWRGRELSAGELLMVYLMVAFGNSMGAAGWDWMTNLPAFLTYAFRFATESNRWASDILPLLPQGLVVSDADAVTGFWEGQMDPYSAAVLGAWWGPTLRWVSFVAVLMWVFFCLHSLLRRRWMEDEKTAFPMVAVPMAMVQPDGSLWRSRHFQLGTAAAAGMVLLNFVHSFVPSIPTIPTWFAYGQYIANVRPWMGIRQPYLWFGPVLIGLSYLIPLDLLLSLWVFVLIGKVQQVLTIQLGWNTETWTGPPYLDMQSFGALVALMASVLWLDRRYLGAVVGGALTGRGPLAEKREALPHRAALAGLALGSAYLWWFLSSLGLSGAAAPAFLGLYLLIGLTITRFRAQLGPPHHEFLNHGPSQVMTTLLGPRAFDGRTLTGFSLLDPFTRSQLVNPTPLTMEAMKMGEGEKTLRGLALPVVTGAALAALSLFWANLHLHYHDGAGTRGSVPPVMVASGVFGGLSNSLNLPSSGDRVALAAMSAGAALCVLLMVLKVNCPSFPLHPVALPVSTGGAIEGTVAAVFIAWAAKAAVLRWGGQRVYRYSLQVALGLIVGDAGMTSLLSLVRQALGLP